MLNNLEIHKRIDDNNRIIQNLFNPNSFVLNNTIKDLLKENEELQKQCNHEFEGGYCIYCYIEEPVCESCLINHVEENND